MKNQVSNRFSNGFTLLEVMVAASLGTVVILTMLSTMVSGTRGYQEAKRRIDALVEARAAMEVIADDAATMVGVGEMEFGWKESDDGFQELWFLTLKPQGAQEPEKAGGDVCYVHYFTAVTPDSPIVESAFSRKLYRRFLNSVDLLGNLRAGQLPEPRASIAQSEAVAFNVTRFVAQPLMVSEEEGELVDWVKGQGVPESLAIELQIVDRDTAEFLKTKEDWELATSQARNLIGNDEEGGPRRGLDFGVNLKIGE